jgi:hypothetical protein
MNVLFILFFAVNVFSKPLPLKDNLLFGFEKCRALSVDLEKGQITETPANTFDAVCRKKGDLNFSCEFYETGSTKKISEDAFTGGSELGIGELKSATGQKITFLIGKPFASFSSWSEQKACVGVFYFELDARKKAKKK